ncbi:MAG: VCBS repeat-containing protein [Planctomycetota bacterium]
MTHSRFSVLMILATASTSTGVAQTCDPQSLLDPDRAYSEGNQPTDIAVADLNGDGLLDMVCSAVADGSGRDDLQIWYNSGAGRFCQPATGRAGQGPNAVATGDLNNDGRPDIAISNGIDDTVSVFYYRDHLRVSGQQVYDVGTTPQDVAIGDVDLDGNADIVSAHALSADVSILYNNGDETFEPEERLEGVAGAFYVSAHVADLTGDGVPDLVAAALSPGIVSIWPGQGSRSFGPRHDIDVCDGPHQLALVDLDLDGSLDLALTCRDDVATLENKGGLSFAPWQTIELPLRPSGITVADFDGDGHQDIAATTGLDGLLRVLLNDGSGLVTEATSLFLSTDPNRIAAGDLNADGTADIAAVTVGGLTPVFNRCGLPCEADLDGDGILTLFDFLEFQNRFALEDARADLDSNCELTIFDFLVYQNLFAGGCP